MTKVNFDAVYDKLVRHSRILSFTKTSLYGIMFYCYVVASNEILISNCDVRNLPYFYLKVFNMIANEMKDFRHGVSR